MRFAQLEEVVEICRRMWTEDFPSFEGEHYTIHEASAPPLPDPVPPICIGASGEQIGLPLVGRQADRWHCGMGRPEDWIRKRGIVHEAASAAGRDPDAIVMCTTVEVPLPETDEDSAQLVERLSGYRDLGVSHFVMDFGNPADTGPILRFHEQVIEPMRG